MSWSDLWTFYRGCDSDEIRNQILKQINLKEFLPHQSYKIQFEILEHAPTDITGRFKSLLSDKACKKLGLGMTLHLEDTDKILRRMFR